MTEYEIIILGIALSLDALIVSICYGLILTQSKLFNALKFSISFGFFQFLMPVLGWYFSILLYDLLQIYSKWIVFLIFTILGVKFLISAFEKTEKPEKTCVSLCCIFCLAIATSIDAFGAGVSLKFLNVPILKPALEIGLITFILSISGFLLAGIFKKLSSKTVAIIGAVMLLYLAVKAVL